MNPPKTDATVEASPPVPITRETNQQKKRTKKSGKQPNGWRKVVAFAIVVFFLLPLWGTVVSDFTQNFTFTTSFVETENCKTEGCRRARSALALLILLSKCSMNFLTMISPLAAPLIEYTATFLIGNLPLVGKVLFGIGLRRVCWWLFQRLSSKKEQPKMTETKKINPNLKKSIFSTIATIKKEPGSNNDVIVIDDESSDESNEAVAVLPDLDGLAKLVLIDLQQNQAQLVIDALGSIFNLLGDESQVEEGYLLGAPALLVVTMNKWKSNKHIQAWCCGCLGQLVYFPVEEEARIVIAKTGCIEAIITAMKLHPDSRSVQTNACRLLMNILSDPDSKSTEELKRYFVQDLKGVEIVFQAMSRWKKLVDLQAAGCGLFSNLSTDQEFNDAMVQAGVVEVVGFALKKYSQESERLKTLAESCLGNFGPQDTTGTPRTVRFAPVAN